MTVALLFFNPAHSHSLARLGPPDWKCKCKSRLKALKNATVGDAARGRVLKDLRLRFGNRKREECKASRVLPSVRPE